jgi:hypothetical protein
LEFFVGAVLAPPSVFGRSKHRPNRPANPMSNFSKGCQTPVLAMLPLLILIASFKLV